MFFNRVILVGRVVADPEVRYTATGSKVANFRLAVDRVPRTSPEGEKLRETDFFRIVVFGNQADFVSTYLTKGRLVLVEGEIRMNSWTDEFGNKRVTYEINAQRVRLLDKKPQLQFEETHPQFEEEPSEDEIILEDEIEEEDLGDDTPPF